jgi:hypothetical protein
MSDELKNPSNDGFDDASEDQQSPRVILGTKLAFSNDSIWVDADDEVVPPGLEVVAVRIGRVLQKWADKLPVETTFLAPGEHPDLEALNEACPQSEWGLDLNGKPRGPWQLQNVVYLVNLETMQKYTYPTGTVGGGVCVHELKDAVQLMRKFRGPGVYPVVSLSDTFMKTKFGGRQRPHFKILRWVTFDPVGTALPPTSPSLLPPSQPEHLDEAATVAPHQAKTKAETVTKAKTKDKSAVPSGARVVEEPTLREDLDDDIPW